MTCHSPIPGTEIRGFGSAECAEDRFWAARRRLPRIRRILRLSSV